MGRQTAVMALALATLPAPASAIVGASADGGPLGASVVMVLNRQGAMAGFCSGIVLRQDVVLSAAHCVPEGATVKIHYRDGSSVALLDVAAVRRSPAFRADAVKRRQRSIDLALIRLVTPLPPAFRPATLGTAEAVPLGTPFRLAGYGVAREGEARTSGVLRTSVALSVSPLSSVLLWSRGPDGEGGACTGDSGGPVLGERDSVVAVIAWSAGRGTARCGALTQSVWVAPHRAWIDGVLAAWDGPP